ncbi:AMP-binding protein, partial [Actinoallomurus spadix]
MLASHPGVRDAAVIAGDGGLVAYYVPVDAPDREELADHCRLRLPDYMVPGVFVAVDRIPLTANGKLDRAALPAFDRQEPQGRRVMPRTATEERVASIWAEVLGLDQVGVEEGFFDLGGHSIRAVALVGALRAAGFDVAVRDVFEYRTVAALCEHLTGRPGRAEVEPGVPPFGLIDEADRAMLPDGVVDAYPMSQVQVGMVVEMLADSGLRAYHNVSSFRVRDEASFSPEAFRRAVALVGARHEVLRTSFDLTGYSVPMQLVHATAGIPVTVRHLGEADPDRALRDFTAAERAHPLDPGTAPLMRITAHVERGPAWWLTVTVCHAITEGWSHRSLLMELLEVYRELREGREPEPPEQVTLRYADFIAAELRSMSSEEDRAYWRGVTEGRARLTLPAGWRGDTDAPPEKYRVAVPLKTMEADLRALASRARVSLKSVLLAAHLKVLSMLTDEPSFFTGLVCSARPEVLGADRVYGMYLNTLPFAYDRGARTWRELVQRVFAQEAEFWPHRRYPMPVIQREAGTERLVQVRFSYQDFHQVDTDLVDVESSLGEGATEFALAVSAVAGHLVLTTDTHTLNRADADRLVGMYRAVLEAMAADADGDARATYLPEGERERLAAWNATTVPRPDGVTVPALFAAQAARTPEATAVECDGTALGYAALDLRARRIAHRLRDAGPTVGVLLDRGPDLLACLLGVWKAGAAYVPLDPSYPAERIAAMLDDAGARTVLTTSAYADRIDRACVLLDRESLTVAADDQVIDPDAPAYVIFTSGSTGRPKGVEVTHRSLVNHVQWAVDELASRGTGGAPLFSSVAFDLVVPNLWAPLLSGQRVHVVPQDAPLTELGPHLAEAGPFSFIKLTPGHLDLLAEQLTTEQAAALAAVLVVAGEPLRGEVAGRSLDILGPGRLINEYGPTEASVGTCVFEVGGGVGREVVPIGWPLPNMEMFVLDG